MSASATARRVGAHPSDVAPPAPMSAHHTTSDTTTCRVQNEDSR